MTQEVKQEKVKCAQCGGYYWEWVYLLDIGEPHLCSKECAYEFGH